MPSTVVDVDPGLQVQAVSVVLATGEKKLSGHLRQAEFPVISLYVPSKQLVHTTPSFPNHPGGHLQAESAVTPVDVVVEFGGQSRQLVLALNALYLPIAHNVHAPLTPLNLPVLHGHIKPALIGLLAFKTNARILAGAIESAISNVPSLSVKIIEFMSPNLAVAPVPSAKAANECEPAIVVTISVSKFMALILKLSRSAK